MVDIGTIIDVTNIRSMLLTLHSEGEFENHLFVVQTSVDENVIILKFTTED